MSMTDQNDRVSSIEQFVNNSANDGSNSRYPIAPSVAPLPAEHPIGAQLVAVKRDERQVLQKIRFIAAEAGEDFYYRYPVRNRDGGTDYIEGPTIKCANAVARLYGNCETNIRVFDTGTHWLFYARFMDLETGYTLERPFQQRKNQKSIKGDAGRMEDITFQIGASKAIRNVTCNALEFFTSRAAEEAKNSIVEKVGKKLDFYKGRVSERLAELGIKHKRVELVRGRALKDWLATDVAKTIAELQAIGDGMATADETYPPLEKEEHIDKDTGEVLGKFASSETAPTAAATQAAIRDDGGGAGTNQDPSSLSSSVVETTTDAGAEDAPSPAPASTNSQSRPAPPPIGTATGAEASPSASAPPSGSHGQRRAHVPNATTVAALEELERGDGEVVSGSTETLHASVSPRTDAEYRAYAAAWIAESTNAEETNARWSREKKLRSACHITQDGFDELETMKKAKVSELKGR